MASGCEAVLYVRDLDRVGTFYESCLGLRRVEAEEGHRRLEAAGLTLWLVRGEDGDAATAPPRRRSNVPVKLCFPVADLDSVRSAAPGAGGALDERVWSFGGRRRSDAVDPEGNIVQVLEG